jgi:hypothetical protein
VSTKPGQALFFYGIDPATGYAGSIVVITAIASNRQAQMSYLCLICFDEFGPLELRPYLGFT